MRKVQRPRDNYTRQNMRILFVSSEFPHARNRTHGIFNLHLVRALMENHQVRVIAPRPWAKILGQGTRRAGGGDSPQCGEFGGMEVEYPSFVYPPKVLRQTYGW